MQTLYDVGATVLIPMKVSRIDINKKSEITYKLECIAMDSSRKDKDYCVFADESFIHSAIADESGNNNDGEQQNPNESEEKEDAGES